VGAGHRRESGIGAALAEELTAGGAHLVLTARRARRLAKLRNKLHAAYGVRIEVVPGDLAQPKTPTEIFAFTQERGITVDLLVNNAGVGSYGAFRAGDRERELGIIRRSGAILIVSSTAAYQGVPYIATYAASKGFSLLFAEALAREVEGHAQADRLDHAMFHFGHAGSAQDGGPELAPLGSRLTALDGSGL
jgi:short-subunit dehydrogenase